ncbi:MAG: AmmeMemoRadiSam system protein A [Gemmatimonadales bacterium]
MAGFAPLSPEDKETLLRLSRQTLTDYLTKGDLPPRNTDSPALLEHRASFVTLRRRDSGELRGCRGEVVARQPLIESVAHMTVSSAVDDPRFPPVTAEETPDIHIEINALTPLAPILPDEIEVGRHGLMIIAKGSSGLLLPEVPVRYQWDRDQFLAALCRKAGLPEDTWRAEDAVLYGFECEIWGESPPPPIPSEVPQGPRHG